MAKTPPVQVKPNTPYVIAAAKRYMATGQGFRVPTMLYTPGASALCAIYEQVFISDEYWTTGHRFLTANWFLTSSTTNAESDNTSSVVIDGAALVYTDITGAVQTVPLKFGGNASVTLTADGTKPHAWTDPFAGWIPPNSKVILRLHRTVATATDKVPGSVQRGYNQTLGERVEVSATSLASKLTAGGISTTIPSGNNVFPFGFIGAVAQGWDGRPVPLVIGTSIEYGQGEARHWTDNFGEIGPIGRGLASKANGAPRLPNINWSVPGATLQGLRGSAAGLGFQRRSQAIAALGLNYMPFTCTICALGTNDQTGSFTWQARFNTTWAALKAALPIPLIQTTMLPRTVSSDAGQTIVNQTPFVSAASFGYPAGNMWVLNAWLKQIPVASGVDRVLDFSDQWDNFPNGGTRGTIRVDALDPWTGTLSAAVSAGASTITMLSLPPQGGVLAFTTDNPELVLFHLTFGSAPPFSISLSSNTVSAHAIGGTVKLANSVDFTHPGAMLNQLVADRGWAPAKLAGLVF